MAFTEEYRRQVALLLRILPYILEEECFALKGGTAINLFVRDLPRLSVDIDLTYVPIRPRAESLKDIEAALKRVGERIKKGLGLGQTQITEMRSDGAVTKLVVRRDGTQVKVEVTPVLRGCVFEPELRRVSPSVEAMFGFAEARVVSFPDLYAGKFVAALDRQHPRDLFDVRDLLANEGIDDALRQAFIVYVLSHNRPIAEILAPNRKSMSPEFERGFVGMTNKPVTVDDLMAAREELITSIVGGMPEAHRRFLMSFKRGAPDWPLLGIVGIHELPAVAWKQQNLGKLPPTERQRLVERLKAILFRAGEP